MALLAFHDVACVRRGRMLFDGLSFVLEPGGAAIVTGPNGVGKSSLIRVAAGLLPPAAGNVERAAPPALLTEATALDRERTLVQALGFWAALDGSRGVDAALADLDLADLAAIPVRLLSTGQRRRAALARVAASPARLWLLDEPANGLDAAAVARLEALIARHRAAGGAVLAATHQPIDVPDAQVIALASRPIVLPLSVRAEPVEAVPATRAGAIVGRPFDTLTASGKMGAGEAP